MVTALMSQDCCGQVPAVLPALLTLSLIDIDHQVLPDLLVLPLLWTGLLFNSLSLFVDLHLAVFGAVAGYLVLWLSCQAHHILTGRAGMGHGDFKLFAAIGAWLGVQMLPTVLALACISCLFFLVYRKYFHGQAMRVPICFGPFLSLGCACNDTWDNPLGGHLILPDPGQIFRL